MVAQNCSLTYAEIAQARVKEDQVLFFQLYKNKDDEKAVEMVRGVEKLGYKAIFLTVDAIVPGFREKDIKAPFVLEEEEREVERKAGKNVPMPDAPQDIEDEDTNSLGTAGALISHTDRDMSWERVQSLSYLPNLFLMTSTRLSHGSGALLSYQSSSRVRLACPVIFWLFVDVVF